MKTSDLLQENDEPIVLAIIRNALKKGIIVRVYHRGDGGIIDSVEWDAAGKGKGDIGSASFKTAGGRWVVVGETNLEKMEVTKRTDPRSPGQYSLTLKAPQPLPRTDEGISAGKEWIDRMDAEFKQLFSAAGWSLKKPATYGMAHGFFGGTIKATAAATRSLLNLNEQRMLIMKLLHKKLQQLSADGLICTVAPFSVRSNPGALQLRPHTTVADMIDTMENGMHLKHDGSAFDAYWSVRVPKDIVDHVKHAADKAMFPLDHHED